MPTFNYTLNIKWEKEAPYKRHYSRDSKVSIEGKLSFYTSADYHFHGNKKIINPEEQLLCAIANCHMLSFMHVCYLQNIKIVAYEDNPEGLLNLNTDGGGEFVKVSLYPKVKVEKEIDQENFEALHNQAKSLCFIARSCNFPIYNFPVVVC